MRKVLILRKFDEIVYNSTNKANLLAFLFEVWAEISLYPLGLTKSYQVDLKTERKWKE